ERFQREALAIAALNHPHICTLYEVGDDDGRPYLVLELLEGETLKARLRRGAPDSDQLLDWGVQISDALDAAHRKGVLHRDLKPDNIWVGPSGHIKVLDFGLARLEIDSGSGETITSPMPLTSPGVAMGTYPYMSPEQAKGQALDPRSDVFSFGSVFYEMASGRPAFAGPSAAEVTASILRSEPKKLREVRPELPPKVEAVAERCLEKDPEMRFQSAADLRSELKRVKRESGSTAAAPASGAAPVSRSRPGWLWPVTAALVGVVAITAWWALHRTQSQAPPHLQFRQITFSGNVVDAVISPDGKFVAHVDNGPKGTSLHLLSVASNSDVEIMPPAPGCCQSPSFSPDGGQVYFLEDLEIKAIPLLGGAVRTIAVNACSGAGFAPDGQHIAYILRNSINQSVGMARADGTGLRILLRAPAGHGYLSQCWVSSIGAPVHAPAWSPDGRWIAVEDAPVSGDGHVMLVDSHSGEAHVLGPALIPTAADLNWLPDGSGIITTAALPSDAVPQAWRIGNPGGQPTQLTNDLQGYRASSLSQLGQLLMVHAAPQASIWVQTRAGGEYQQLPGGGADQEGTAAGVAWTPQGGLITIRRLGGKPQIWAENSDGSNAHALLADQVPAGAYDLHVTPQGQITFGENGDQATVWRMNGDGSGLAALVRPARGAAAFGGGPILGGTAYAYMATEANDSQTMWSVPLAGGAPRQVWPGRVYAGSG
ncbi:MAG: protein kinase domain-containing protein, partial [Terriglobales bacterium]